MGDNVITFPTRPLPRSKSLVPYRTPEQTLTTILAAGMAVYLGVDPESREFAVVAMPRTFPDFSPKTTKA